MASLASGSKIQKLTKRILLERNKNLNVVAEHIFGDLDSVQTELDRLDKQVCEEKAVVATTYERLKNPVYNKRDELIKNIQYFWIQSFQNHSDICSLIDKESGEILRYLTRLQVQVVETTSSKVFLKLKFFFSSNPHFENEVLTKEVVIKNDDIYSVTNTIIRWKQRKQRGEKTKTPSVVLGKRRFEEGSFFDWFEDNNSENYELIDSFKELHQDPLMYFRRSDSDDSDSHESKDSCEGDETSSTEEKGDEEMDYY